MPSSTLIRDEFMDKLLVMLIVTYKFMPLHEFSEFEGSPIALFGVDSFKNLIVQ